MSASALDRPGEWAVPCRDERTWRFETAFEHALAGIRLTDPFSFLVDVCNRLSLATMSTRLQNEKKFAQWDELAGGGRRYRLDVPGARAGWLVTSRKWTPMKGRCVSGRRFTTTEANWWKRMKNSRWIKATRKCRMTPMTITKQAVADQDRRVSSSRDTLAQLVDWAERALMDGEFAEPDAAALSQVVSRLGVADVRAFGLAWDDCEELLRKLGFAPRVEVVAV